MDYQAMSGLSDLSAPTKPQTYGPLKGGSSPETPTSVAASGKPSRITSPDAKEGLQTVASDIPSSSTRRPSDGDEIDSKTPFSIGTLIAGSISLQPPDDDKVYRPSITPPPPSQVDATTGSEEVQRPQFISTSPIILRKPNRGKPHQKVRIFGNVQTQSIRDVLFLVMILSIITTVMSGVQLIVYFLV
jgi:hypothetical protein